MSNLSSDGRILEMINCERECIRILLCGDDDKSSISNYFTILNNIVIPYTPSKIHRGEEGSDRYRRDYAIIEYVNKEKLNLVDAIIISSPISDKMIITIKKYADDIKKPVIYTSSDFISAGKLCYCYVDDEYPLYMIKED